MNDRNKIICEDWGTTIFSIESYRHGNFEVKIDTEDIEKIKDYKWSVHFKKGRLIGIRSNYKFGAPPIRLHSFITGYIMCDHINGNVCDNRKSNLRECSKLENNRNVKLHRDNKIGYKGVSFWKNKYIARICVNYKLIYIGSYNTKEEAAQAYNEKAIEHFGEFARLNNVR